MVTQYVCRGVVCVVRLDHVGDLVGVLVLPWFLGGTVANAFAAEVDVFVATGGVGGDGGGREGELGAGSFA